MGTGASRMVSSSSRRAAGQLSGTPSTVTPQSCRRIRSLISL